MTNDDNSGSNKEPNFSFGTRELRTAKRNNDALALESTPAKRDTGGGFDPYNTSGSFDRRKNWSRVGKR
jgi:hypothetical protein